ncbi:MAG: hypothetical protein PWR24_1187 [Desulfonauticus sp.]|nr:hypothetical protein [Desulfonauticus sp.]
MNLTFFRLWIEKKLFAGVVKLVDALDSKSSGLRSVRVRVSPPAPGKKALKDFTLRAFLFFSFFCFSSLLRGWFWLI